TTNKQSLTLGGVDTGNIVLNGFTGNNAVLYGTAGSGILASATIGVAGQCFTSSGTPFAPSWQACPGSGSGASKWSAVLTSIVPTDITDKVGIGTASDVPSSFYVTRDLASGALGKALAIFDQTESQDILTASAGGVTKFTILNNGIASSAGGFTINGAGSIQTTNAQTLTIGGSTTGNIVLNGFTGNNAVLYGTAGSGILASATIGVAGQCFTSSGTPFAPSWQACPGSGSGASKWSAVLTSIVPTDITDKVGIGTASDVPSSFYVTRDLASGALGKALAIFDQTESQDILTASAGGTTRFRIQNTGELVFGDDTSSFFGTLNPTTLTANRTYTFPNADGTICLNSNNCSFALGTNYWTIPTNTGALTPINSTLDLLIGGTTTSSANLRVTGNSAFAGTTSAASIAAKTSFAGFVVDN
ncbi:MAG: hypothetical protein AAB675_04190, partial [Patescibacteria group bacterium]